MKNVKIGVREKATINSTLSTVAFEGKVIDTVLRVDVRAFEVLHADENGRPRWILDQKNIPEMSRVETYQSICCERGAGINPPSQ